MLQQDPVEGSFALAGVRVRSGTLIRAAAVLVFAVYAASFLYFFVDDEAIPLVYARNLLRGHGLIYSSVEGPVEGYSDFLHVLWSALLLAISRVMHLSSLAPLNIGKGVSFALGIAIIVTAGRMMERAGADRPGLISGVGFLALAGPLALWSCSSLETVPFALVVTLLVGSLLPGQGAQRQSWPILLASVAILQRIDGFLYVGVVLFASALAMDPGRRPWLLRRVVLPVLAFGALYHAWRYVYFGTLLSAPLQAKILYKLSPAGHAIVKSPERSYLRGFADLYGLALAPALAVAVALVWRLRSGRAASLALVLLSGYVAMVGDWMFGWRFVVPLLPLAAFVVALAVSRLRRPLAWIAACAVILWSAAGARAFAREYVALQGRPIWWAAPRQGPSVWLAPYGDLIPTAERAIARGERIAYNQAGLLPFVLDADNVDDLRICSKFEAALPTTDVYFTEVGRYSPLTDAPVLTAAHAYLLYRDVRMLLSRTDLLTNANNGRIPEELLGGYFRRIAIDPAGENALYGRTEKDASAYRRDPRLFRENLAHTSRLRRVDVDGRELPDSEIGPAFPFLRWQTGHVHVRDRTRIDIWFADRDEDVYTVYAGALSARGGAVAVTFTLFDADGRAVAHETAQPDDSPAPLITPFQTPVRAQMLSISAYAADGDADLVISDLRVDGQSAALRDYVRRTLTFPADGKNRFISKP